MASSGFSPAGDREGVHQHLTSIHHHSTLHCQEVTIAQCDANAAGIWLVFARRCGCSYCTEGRNMLPRKIGIQQVLLMSASYRIQRTIYHIDNSKTIGQFIRHYPFKGLRYSSRMFQCSNLSKLRSFTMKASPRVSSTPLNSRHDVYSSI